LTEVDLSGDRMSDWGLELMTVVDKTKYCASHLRNIGLLNITSYFER